MTESSPPAVRGSQAAKIVRASVLESAGASFPQSSSGPGNAQHQRVAIQSRYNVAVPLRDGSSLVYNSLSGSFARWDEEDIRIYDSVACERMDIGGELLRPFLAGGYVIPEGTEEMEVLEEEYKKKRFDPSRMTLTIAPTLACNFGCDYCFQGMDKPGGGMLPEVKDALSAYLRRKLPDLKTLGVAWYGGEPLIARQAICELSDQIIPLCKEYAVGYTAFMVTNGFSLTPQVAEELYERKVTTYQVTLDGPEDYHDGRRHLLSGRPTYSRILDNLCQVVDAVPANISIRVNIDSRNYDRIRDLIDDLVDRGLGGRKNFHVYFAPVEAITEGCHGCADVAYSKRGYGQLEADLFRYAYEKQLTPLPKPPRFFGICQAVRPHGLLLTPTGDLHKCWDTVQVPSMKVGTIFEPEKLAESPLHKQWLGWSPFGNDICRNCKILPNCVGACAYKFIHSDKTRGEAGALPCPSWKFNINERLFLRAEKMGIVVRDDWDDEASPTSQELVGENHSFESVAAGSEYGVGGMPSLPILD